MQKKLRHNRQPARWSIISSLSNKERDVSELTQSPQWQALQSHASEMKKTHLRELFQDSTRFGRLSIDKPELGMFLDYSKNLVSGETMMLLRDLAQSAGVTEHAANMFAG